MKLINNRAVPANQPLPPAMPGYDKSYTGYAYNPDEARRSCSQKAGLGSGFDDRSLCHERRSRTRASPRQIQQDLGKIGIKRRSEVARPGHRHRRRRQEGRRADDLVRRHGLDRRLPGSQQLLHRDPGLRRRGRWRLELGLVLQQGSRRPRRQGQCDDRSRASRCACRRNGARSSST